MENGGMKIEDLARITQKGFEEVNVKIDDLEYKIDKRFDQLEKVIFGEYKNRIDKLEDRVDGLEEDYRELLSIKK